MLLYQVAPHFQVAIEERVYILDDDDPALRRQIAPDLFVVERPSTASASASAGATATPPTIIERLPATEVVDRYLAIYDRRNRELVTTIDVLSPRNKASGSRGRSEFLAKRASIFASRSNWIELDLLRAGERPTEVANQSDYYALLRRIANPDRLEVWYVDLRDPLPRVLVPLREPHPDVVLDVQAALSTVYQRGHYADEIDYQQPVPPPALRPADVAWNGRCWNR